MDRIAGSFVAGLDVRPVVAGPATHPPMLSVETPDSVIMKPDLSNTLYRERFERDNCGFGLIAHMDGEASHGLVTTAIRSLARMTHRGAIAADGKTGDGCGLLIRKPDAFLRAVAASAGMGIGENYAVGAVFLNPDLALAQQAREILAAELSCEGLGVAGWRQVPVNPDACGEQALAMLPRI